jgi:glycosyltransferase involved in cell wall biosynthesis
MKVLLYCQVPFMLAHGGAQIQIEQTKAALEQQGVEAEWLRWWDGGQTGDILHYFGRMSPALMELAQRKGMKVVMADLLTAQGSRPAWRRKMQKAAMGLISRTAGGLIGSLNWRAYRQADALVALTEWEAFLMSDLFGAPPDRIHVIPNGVEEAFLRSVPRERGSWLVCTATITERKRVLELAEAALIAQTPLWVIGKPYSEADPYGRRFVELARQNPKLLRYEGAINDRARLATIYREARGSVLLSTMESLSLSALEAAACECPLLLSDLPWARTVFGKDVSYCAITGARETAGILRQFYDAAPRLGVPPKPLSWAEVAEKLTAVYRE